MGKNALIKKFGNMAYAWEAIDSNGDGDLSFPEFVQACRRIQFVGNLRKIFNELSGGADYIGAKSLDKSLQGGLNSPRNQDLKTVHLLSTEAKSFKAALCNHYGNLTNAWLAIVYSDDELKFHVVRAAGRRIEFYGNIR